MSGFDSGYFPTSAGSRAKQAGSVLLGDGAPAPAFGVVGDAYMDRGTGNLYQRRAFEAIDAWGHHLFQIPEPYRATLRWWGSVAPSQLGDFGDNGDYFMLIGGSSNYGIDVTMYGPKAGGAWPTVGFDPAVTINPLFRAIDVNVVTP